MYNYTYFHLFGYLYYMEENSPKTPPKRAYPQFFEKSIPIAIGLLVVIIVGILIFALAVIFGFV
ncbi:MAG: hypothetical protein ACWGOY_13720 [Anaerolineales bacterium]